MKIIKELLTGKKLYFASVGMNISEVVKIMDEQNIGIVPVLDEKKILIGIFSERDLLKRCVMKELDFKKTNIEEVMTKDVFYVNSEDSIEDCLIVMKQKNIRHVPVIEGENLIGIISIRDLMLFELKDKDEKIELLNSYIWYKGT